jgi:hypothetical protein
MLGRKEATPAEIGGPRCLLVCSLCSCRPPLAGLTPQKAPKPPREHGSQGEKGPTSSVLQVWRALEPMGPTDGRHDYVMWR